MYERNAFVCNVAFRDLPPLLFHFQLIVCRQRISGRGARWAGVNNKITFFFTQSYRSENIDVKMTYYHSGHEGQCKGKDQKFYKLGEVIKDEPCVRKICKGTAAPGSVYIEVERWVEINFFFSKKKKPKNN